MSNETSEQYRERMLREHGEGWALKVSPTLKAYCEAMAKKYRRFKRGWAYHCTQDEENEYRRLYCEATRSNPWRQLSLTTQAWRLRQRSH